MKISKEFTTLEKSAVKLTVTVAKDDVNEAYKSILEKYTKNAQIPGFRKGHVPANVLERKFGDTLNAEAMSEVIDKSLNEIFENETENRPLPYNQPVMDTMPAFDREKDFVYSVTYDTFPKVSVKDFSGITIKEPQVSITDKDMENELKEIQERNAVVMDKKDDEKLENGDIVTINYSELDESDKEIDGSKREGFVFTVGTGQNIYKIDDEILGMKKNDTKIITKTYNSDDADKDLAGKTKKISITITAIKIRQLPALDDDLAQDVNEKFKTLEDLKNDIKRNMETAKNRRIAELKSQSLLEQLVEKNPFEIPDSMLQAELNGRWHLMAQQFQTTPEQLEKLIESSGQTKEKMLADWTGNSEKMLKSRIIVETLMKDKNISVTPEEIEKRYEQIAEEGGITVEDVKKHYADARSKEYLVDDAKEQKLYEEIYKEVKISKGDKMSFEDLFKNAQ
ncbi:MAG: trigger factor [Treponemataceae bacterium]|nr:trigger factor [Treponemataceae bacterium]